MISWFEEHNKISWVITIIIAITIFSVSSLTFEGYPSFGWRTIAYHFYSFLFLGAFLLISFTKGKSKNIRFLFIGVIIALFYAIADEVHQMFVPGRACTFSDFLTDSAGILFATLIYSLKFLSPKKEINKEYNSDLYY